jgi:hypothetical protein
MAAITISAPIVAKAPVAMRRTRVTARAAVAPAASTSAVSFGARKMMTGASVQAARVQQTAAGRKSLVWCVLRPDTPPESTLSNARASLLRARAPRSTGPPAGRPTRPAADRSHRVLVHGKKHERDPSVAESVSRLDTCEQTVCGRLKSAASTRH